MQGLLNNRMYVLGATAFLQFLVNQKAMLDTSSITSGTFFSMTLFVNSILIYLTLYQTKEAAGTYRNMIIAFAGIGISFSTLNLLVRPMIHSFNSSISHLRTVSECPNIHQSGRCVSWCPWDQWRPFWSVLLWLLCSHPRISSCSVHV